MTTSHVLAFVNYRFFRKSAENRTRFGKAYTYVSRRRRVLDLVGDGGTLWIITSFPRKGSRIYSLAYKLAKCEPMDVPDHLRRFFGDFGVIGDFNASHHYPRNDIKDVLLSLKFDPARPIKAQAVIGMSLMTARKLAPEDVMIMERYEEKVRFGRYVFISYSSRDRAYAESLYAALAAHGHTVWLDQQSIPGGAEWASEIATALERTDVFILLISAQSAASTWVATELRAALALYGQPSGVQRILPVVLTADAWESFPDVHRFQRYEWSGSAQTVPARLVEDLRRALPT